MIKRSHFSLLSELSFIRTRPAGSRLTLALLLISGLTVWVCGGDSSVTTPGETSTVEVVSVYISPSTHTLLSGQQ